MQESCVSLYIKKRTKHGVRSLTKEPHKPPPNLHVEINIVVQSYPVCII
jgi:hypothetical protein